MDRSHCLDKGISEREAFTLVELAIVLVTSG